MKEEQENEKNETISQFEDLMELVGTSGWKNYLLFTAASLCGFQKLINNYYSFY